MSSKSPPRKDPEVEGEGGEEGKCVCVLCAVVGCVGSGGAWWCGGRPAGGWNGWTGPRTDGSSVLCVRGTERKRTEEEVPHYESTAVFQPVVQLDEVETKTHEEDEETLYKM